MSNWLLGIVSIIYLATAIDYLRQNNIGLCITFVAYALANIGIMLASGK